MPILFDPNGILIQGFILLSGVIGQLYVSHMNARGFYWWIASNVALVAVSLHFSSWGSAALYTYFTVMAVYSIYKWKKLQGPKVDSLNQQLSPQGLSPAQIGEHYVRSSSR